MCAHVRVHKCQRCGLVLMCVHVCGPVHACMQESHRYVRSLLEYQPGQVCVPKSVGVYVCMRVLVGL